jgi:agmatine deiminase
MSESKPPAELGYRRPAEWEPHTRTWLSWPHHRTDFPGKLQGVRWVFCEMARHLSVGERIGFLVRDASHKAALRRHLERAHVDVSRIDLVVCPTNRSWTRDYVPEFVVPTAKSQGLGAVKFEFNGWARYRDHAKDEAAGQKVARRAARHWFPKYGSRRWVLEGGGIDLDGLGTLLTTEHCLLTGPRVRNPGTGRGEVEAMFADYLGVKKTIWLPDGVAGDDTSGHIDDIARFVAPGKVVIVRESDPKDENYTVLEACRERLVGARDARGKRIEVIDLPMPAPLYFAGDRLPASYANFYVGNEAVLVPTFNDPMDARALGTLSELFKGRRVVGIHSLDLVLGLGSVHCSTHEEPRV